jgi:CBS domain-containing protein
MRCYEVMKREVAMVTADASAEEAARVMRDRGVGFLPVCDDRGRVIGCLTDRDLALRVCTLGRSAHAVMVAEVMTLDVVACYPDDELWEAERLMCTFRKSRIVCVDDDGRPVGVISLSDVAVWDSGSALEAMQAVVMREV